MKKDQAESDNEAVSKGFLATESQAQSFIDKKKKAGKIQGAHKSEEKTGKANQLMDSDDKDTMTITSAELDEHKQINPTKDTSQVPVGVEHEPRQSQIKAQKDVMIDKMKQKNVHVQ